MGFGKVNKIFNFKEKRQQFNCLREKTILGYNNSIDRNETC